MSANMLAVSPSHTSQSKSSLASEAVPATRGRNDIGNTHVPIKSSVTREKLSRPYPPHSPHPVRRYSARSLDSYSPPVPQRGKMVDAATQYSPPSEPHPPPLSQDIPSTTISDLKIVEPQKELGNTSQERNADWSTDSIASNVESTPEKQSKYPTSASTSKRPAFDSSESADTDIGSKSRDGELVQDVIPKRARPEDPEVRLLPQRYEDCDTRDLVMLIASMLLELVRHNDSIPLREGHLTRFHSRAPPGISVVDYLQRLTTHATLSPPILLSMVYYIDKLCAMYPAFTISSLTVHRFLIASATVASKGLSDSFWTNKTYARVGGVSIKELALLELDFLTRVDWRIVPNPEVLCDYYKSLVNRSNEYQLIDAT